VGIIVAGVWIWKRLPIETQDLLAEQVVPAAFLAVAVGLSAWLLIRRVRIRWKRRALRDQLIAQFEKEVSREKRLDLALSLVEINDYHLEGLERVASAMAELFLTVLKTAVGDKQHRIRGMAASHLGALQHKAAVPALLKALEDDHAYVRSSAVLALGRMRVSEAKAKLTEVMKEDWDQTVRSRAREALERIP
jgi:HEAT repeat protein